MASVTLEYLYVHLSSDDTVFVALLLDGASGRTSKPGEVRRRANGRLVWVGRAGSVATYVARCEQVSRDDLHTLNSWVEDGEELMVRDPRERLFWAHLDEVPFDEYVANDLVDVVLTFTEVTHSEVV